MEEHVCPKCVKGLIRSNSALFTSDLKKYFLSYHYTRNVGFSATVVMRCKNNHIVEYGCGPSNYDRTYTQRYTCVQDQKVTRRRKLISYDVNILMALVTYFNGAGFYEIARLAGFMGLPNSTSIEWAIHKVSKAYLHGHIMRVTKKVVLNSLVEEAKEAATLQFCEDEFSTLWPAFEKVIRGEDICADTLEILRKDPIKMSAGLDMGWQKRSSGRKYDSPSGHMFMIGTHTNKVIDYMVMSINCAICKLNEKRVLKGEPAKEHTCFKNFDLHSKAMEACAARLLVINMFTDHKGVLYYEDLCADDDSSMKSYCSHNGDKASLPLDIPQPLFYADPSHRIKLVGKAFYELAYATKGKSLVTISDATRLKINFAYLVTIARETDGMTVEMLSDICMCVIDHVFDCHWLCSPSFCWKRRKLNNYLNTIISNMNDHREDWILYPERHRRHKTVYEYHNHIINSGRQTEDVFREIFIDYYKKQKEKEEDDKKQKETEEDEGKTTKYNCLQILNKMV